MDHVMDTLLLPFCFLKELWMENKLIDVFFIIASVDIFCEGKTTQQILSVRVNYYFL